MPFSFPQSRFAPITGFIMAFFFIGIGLLITYLMGKVGVLDCARNAGQSTCKLETTWMGLFPLDERSLSNLTGAEVQENCDTDGCTYRVMIDTTEGTLPLEEGYSSGEAPKQTTANQVTDYVRDSSVQSLHVSAGGGFWILIPLIFVAAGLFMLAGPLVAGMQGLVGLLRRED